MYNLPTKSSKSWHTLGSKMFVLKCSFHSHTAPATCSCIQ